MSVKIRLKRVGGKGRPHSRIVVTDTKTRRDGRPIEEVGYYDPTQDPPLVKLNAERVKYWIGVGAQPSDTVRSLIKQMGVFDTE